MEAHHLKEQLNGATAQIPGGLGCTYEEAGAVQGSTCNVDRTQS